MVASERRKLIVPTSEDRSCARKRPVGRNSRFARAVLTATSQKAATYSPVPSSSRVIHGAAGQSTASAAPLNTTMKARIVAARDRRPASEVSSKYCLRYAPSRPQRSTGLRNASNTSSSVRAPYRQSRGRGCRLEAGRS